MIIFVSLCCLATASTVWSKRVGPPTVATVMYEDKSYVVPNDDGFRGYVEAWDIKTLKKLWEKTIFTVPYEMGPEDDVQWIFIKTMQIKDGNLLITDERDRQFLLDLKKEQIKVLQ